MALLWEKYWLLVTLSGFIWIRYGSSENYDYWCDQNPVLSLESLSHCGEEVHLSCRVYRGHATYDGFNLTGSMWPTAVSSLTIQPWYGRNLSQAHPSFVYLGLNISWRLPHDETFVSLKGYELCLVSLDHVPRVNICRLFDMRDASWRSSDRYAQVDFYYSLFPVAGDASMLLTLHSLPKAPSTDQHGNPVNAYVTNIQTPQFQHDCDSRMQTWEWRAFIMYTLHESQGEIDVQFQHADHNYAFTAYDVMLVRSSDTDRYVQMKRIMVFPNMTRRVSDVLFTGVHSDNYQVMIKPRREKSNATETHHCTHLCTATITDVFNFTSDLDGINHPHHDHWWQFAAIALVAIFVCVVGIALFIKYRISKTIAVEVRNSGEVNANYMKSKKRVLLVYNNDNPFHRAAVHHLAAFLHNRCHCNCRLDQWSIQSIVEMGKTQWLQREIEQADSILIINSGGAFIKYSAYQSPGPQSGGSEDIMAMAIDHLVNAHGESKCLTEKLVLVSFPYTSKKHYIRNFPGKPVTYTVLKQMPHLLQTIHGQSQRGVCSRLWRPFGFLTSADRHLMNTEEVVELKRTINLARKFVRVQNALLLQVSDVNMMDTCSDSGNGSMYQRSNATGEHERLLSHSQHQANPQHYENGKAPPVKCPSNMPEVQQSWSMDRMTSCGKLSCLPPSALSISSLKALSSTRPDFSMISLPKSDLDLPANSHVLSQYSVSQPDVRVLDVLQAEEYHWICEPPGSEFNDNNSVSPSERIQLYNAHYDDSLNLDMHL